MLGAIAGDIIGSVYEWAPIKTKDFPLFKRASHFTDDTVLSCAVADCLLNGSDYSHKLQEYWRLYPQAGYGKKFVAWAEAEEKTAYYSWGNGSAMRVSPVGFACSTLTQVLTTAQASAVVTHNHPEGIKGAQAVAAAVFLAKNQQSKEQIKDYLSKQFAYQLDFTLAEIRPNYVFDVSCQGTVPAAIVAFLEAADFVDAIRNAISLGGDSDTLACITGGIAQAFYGIPLAIRQQTLQKLDEHLRKIVLRFEKNYMCGDGKKI